ncbi:MAG: phosphocholine cytidylyltransferase family protein [Lachnospiraceae bacterium]|nr:phosphocholine cytidylyltransferase family protein [Lachnospiraceae bacterium]
MKALILNSGMGSRMGEETRDHPKCMTRLNGGDTILSRQLRLLYGAGIRDVVMTTGYCSNVLMEYTDRIAGSMNVTYVENKKYESTNYIYSIYLADSCLKEDILLLHGDLVFEDSVLRKLLETKESCMVVDQAAELPEKDFKAVISDGRIVKVGVEFFERAAAAQPFYKILRNDWLVWLNEIKEFCQQGRVTCYAEAALNAVSDRCVITPLDIKGGLCGEIDTLEDRERIVSVLSDDI